MEIPLRCAWPANRYRFSSAQCHSCWVGPLPVNTPRAEWYGPVSMVAPKTLAHSMAFWLRSSAARRTVASGLMAWCSGPQKVTATRSRPSSSRRLAHSRHWSGIKNGHFDAVETDFPDGFQYGDNRIVQLRSPQQQIHSKFHSARLLTFTILSPFRQRK